MTRLWVASDSTNQPDLNSGAWALKTQIMIQKVAKSKIELIGHVGISVETATDVAKDAADIVLLAKDLDILAGGVVEGRRIFANTLGLDDPRLLFRGDAREDRRLWQRGSFVAGQAVARAPQTGKRLLSGQRRCRPKVERTPIHQIGRHGRGAIFATASSSPAVTRLARDNSPGVSHVLAATRCHGRAAQPDAPPRTARVSAWGAMPPDLCWLWPPEAIHERGCTAPLRHITGVYGL
jgi:hypothetical protein